MSQSQESNNLLVIIDGNAIIHRGYHALPPMTTKDGTLVHAVFGFATTLLKTIEQLQPTHLAVSFDVAGGTFRDEIFEDYKATRERADQDLYDQIPFVYELVEAFNIPIYTKEGFEADDVIGTIAEQMKTKTEDVNVVIITGDKDLLQLVDGKRVQVDLLRRGMGDLTLYDTKAVTERFGFGPDRITDFKGLMGDPSDNIPGVKGVGEKTATKLIQATGTIEALYDQLSSGEGVVFDVVKGKMKEKLVNGEADARLSKELATIVRDVPDIDFVLEEAMVHDFDAKELGDAFKKFEFYSLLKRIPGAEGSGDATSEKKGKKRKAPKLILVDEASFDSSLKTLQTEKELGLLPVFSKEDSRSGTLQAFLFMTKKQAYYIEFTKISDAQRENVKTLFTDKKKTIIAHDVKAVVKALFLDNVIVEATLFDTMLASYVLDPSRKHTLEQLLMRELEVEVKEEKSQGTLFGVDPRMLLASGQYLLELYETLNEQLDDVDEEHVFDTLEMPVLPVLAVMELAGIELDRPFLEKMSEDIQTTIDALTDAIYKEAGVEFNIASSSQLRDVLFDTMGLPTEGIKKGKTGYSTAASELEKLRPHHEIIPMIEQYREITKLKNTYTDVLPTLVHDKTKRIHSKFNQATAATGRLSSSDPNLQNIPIRTELGQQIRHAFVSQKGYDLLVADYSQIELRIAASLSEDPAMIKVFNDGEDIHSATAAILHRCPIEEVTKEMRYRAKAINFGVLFGMGAYGVAARTDLSNYEAKEFVETYFGHFSGLKTYLDQVIEDAKETGYAETLFGRKRYVPELSASNYQMRQAAERVAVNMPIQGTEADMIKLAMIRLFDMLQEKGYIDLSASLYDWPVRILLQVHDELVLEVKEGMEATIAPIMREAMEKVCELHVPILVDMRVGKNWGSLEAFDA